MNLSEIRKKAQRDREANGVPAIRSVAIGGGRRTDADEIAVAPLAADPGSFATDGRRIIPFFTQGELFPPDFDPVSVPNRSPPARR